MGLSVIINTKNAVNTLERAISSVLFADEIVVVDMQSTDGTVEHARKLGATVFTHKDVGYVEPARQFAIEKALHDWVLVLDADEVIPKKLADVLQNIISKPSDGEIVAYALPRKNRIFGEWILFAGWWPDYQIRLFRRGKVQWSEEIHSVPTIMGKTSELPANANVAIEHYNYETVSEFLQRLDRYTTIQATSDGIKQSGVTDASVVSVFRSEFLSRLFAQGGISGGTHGMSLVFLQSFSEVIRHVKQWELSGFTPKKETPENLVAIQRFQSELAYWIADRQVRQSSGLSKLWWKLRRKLQV